MLILLRKHENNTEKIGHEMAFSRAILGQILAILGISDQKNDQPVFEGKSLLVHAMVHPMDSKSKNNFLLKYIDSINKVYIQCE